MKLMLVGLLLLFAGNVFADDVTPADVVTALSLSGAVAECEFVSCEVSASAIFCDQGINGLVCNLRASDGTGGYANVELKDDKALPLFQLLESLDLVGSTKDSRIGMLPTATCWFPKNETSESSVDSGCSLD